MRKDKKEEQWFEKLAQNLLASLIFSALVAVFTRYGRSWTKPVLIGLLAGTLLSSFLFLLRIALALPRIEKPTTTENIEDRVRTWLDSFAFLLSE